MGAPEETAQVSRLKKAAHVIGALAIFLAAAACVYGDTWLADPTRSVTTVEAATRMGILQADQTMTVWTVARNARAFVTQPLEFFDTNHCFPAKKALALGEPMISMGLVGVLPYQLTGDPLYTYNLVLVLTTLIGAMAMYWLVGEWTTSPAAGVAAGLLYAFHPIRLADVIHPYIYDTAWTVLALLFARRLFAFGRWRDAVGLAVAVSLQVGASFYPFVGAALCAAPFTVWLLLRYRLRRARLVQLGVIVALVALAGVFVFGPFLELRASGVLFGRGGLQRFEIWPSYLPGGKLFLGWPCLALVAASLVLSSRRSLCGIEGDPRWALVAGALVVMVAGAGPGADYDFIGRYGLPNLWRVLASVLPGFETVRVPARVATVFHVSACILAGVGLAALLRAWRRGAWLLAIVAISLIFVDVVRPPVFGLESPLGYAALELRPDEENLEFFEMLEEQGDEGPLFEWPIRVSRLSGWFSTAPEVLMSAYHHRQTSACYTSFPHEGRAELERINDAMPARAAIEDLHRLGFRTILFHHEVPFLSQGKMEQALMREAHARDGTLRLIRRTPRLTAYRIDVGRVGRSRRGGGGRHGRP